MKKTNNLIKLLLEKYKKIPVAARAGMWFVACSMLQKCLSFITVPIFTRLMPTEEYGLYSTYLSWYSVLTVFCTLNMHSVVYVNDYTKARTQKEKDYVAIPLLTLSSVITMCVFIIYLIFHSFLTKIIGMPFILVCLLFAQILFEPPLNFWTMQQRFEFKYIALVVRTITMVCLNAVLGIIFVWLSHKDQAIARACSIVLVQLIFGGFFYLYFWKRGKKIISTQGWKHALSVELPLLPHSLSLTILSSSDRIMIKNMIGAAQAGIYSVAYSAGFVVNILKNSIVDALKPWMYRKIKNEDFQSISKILNAIMIFVTLISALFMAFAPEVIYIMAPPKYHEAVYVVPPVAASSFFTFLYNIFSILGLYYEKAKKIMIASVSGAVLNLILNAICLPVFGYIAAAYTTLVCYIFFSIAHYIIMKSICKEHKDAIKIYDLKFIFLMSVVIIILTIAFSFTYKNIIIRYAMLAVLLIILFFKRKLFIQLFKEIKKK